ncbi:hypothetical protein [Helicobacter apodemus]|nr:hypothetical protein [Helicobacter apodemus]
MSVSVLSGIGINIILFKKYHSFESHFENPEFQLQQTIQAHIPLDNF